MAREVVFRALRSGLRLACLAVIVGACGKGGSAGLPTVPDVAPLERPAAATVPAAKAAEPMVIFDTPQGAVPVIVEIAATEEQRRIGLMHRRFLEPGHGMIFLMPKESAQVFWMRNTLIPLDMIFINDALEVVGVVERATPLTETPRGVSRPSRYVVEIDGGQAGPAGIGVGTTVRLVGIPQLSPAR